jgi:hypothetical protein
MRTYVITTTSYNNDYIHAKRRKGESEGSAKNFCPAGSDQTGGGWGKGEGEHWPHELEGPEWRMLGYFLIKTGVLNF